MAGLQQGRRPYIFNFKYHHVIHFLSPTGECINTQNDIDFSQYKGLVYIDDIDYMSFDDMTMVRRRDRVAISARWRMCCRPSPHCKSPPRIRYGSARLPTSPETEYLGTTITGGHSGGLEGWNRARRMVMAASPGIDYPPPVARPLPMMAKHCRRPVAANR